MAGPGGRGVLDLPSQVLHPVLQVLLVGAHHLQTLKHRACRERERESVHYKSIQDKFISLSICQDDVLSCTQTKQRSLSVENKLSNVMVIFKILSSLLQGILESGLTVIVVVAH